MTSCFLWNEELPLKSGKPSASHRCTWNTTKNGNIGEMQSTDSLSRVWQTGPGYCIKATNVTLDCIPVSSLAGDTCHIPHETVDPLFVFRRNQTALGIRNCNVTYIFSIVTFSFWQSGFCSEITSMGCGVWFNRYFQTSIASVGGCFTYNLTHM